jgi:hypothetical protein
MTSQNTGFTKYSITVPSTVLSPSRAIQISVLVVHSRGAQHESKAGTLNILIQVVRGFTQSLQANRGISFHFKSFLIHHSKIAQ